MLAGIVAMQVEVLKMSAGIGRSMADSSQLQIRNEQLSATLPAASTLIPAIPANNGLASQLNVVARIIAARAALGMGRRQNRTQPASSYSVSATDIRL